MMAINSSKPWSIIYKRDINSIGHTFLLARQAIESDNKDLALNSKQVLRLILLGCSVIIQKNRHPIMTTTQKQTSSTNFCPSEIHLSNNWICEYIGISSENLSRILFDNAWRHLVSLLPDPRLVDLLPYALELLDYSDNDLASATKDRRDGLVTKKKKDSGIYYTPVDVAHYMVISCLDRLSDKHDNLANCKYIDFSCGSGIFLLQLVDEIVERCQIRTYADYVTFIKTSIFGIDISEHAVDCARFLLLQYGITRFCSELSNPKELFEQLEQNIVCADATKIKHFFSTTPSFPNKFDCIIGNPPYVGINDTADHTARSNLFIPFVYNLMDYSATNSVSALILPLSFAYNNQSAFCQMRHRISNDSGEWQVENYDRSPDSLFGDDVKARTCIVFRETGNIQHKIFVSGLIRWTSSTRGFILSARKQLVDISDVDITDFIPKLSSSIEKDAYTIIAHNPHTLKKLLTSNSHVGENPVVIKGTAYNWICAYDHTPTMLNSDATIYKSQSMKSYSAQTTEDRYFLLAVLNSRIAFWLWTVVGDGFHVTNRLLNSIRFDENFLSKSQLSKLVSLGKDFSCKLTQHPVISVNSGKTITSYSHYALLDLISEIDNTIVELLNLPVGFPEYLEHWYSNIVSCGRELGEQP